MTKVRKVGPTIGCLMIEDFASGGVDPSGLCAYLKAQGICAQAFEWAGQDRIHARLQNAYFQVRSACGIAGIVARDRGIDAAIALSVQLPVERLVLIRTGDDGRIEDAHMRRQLTRISRFARRNKAFCVSDVLIVSDKDAMEPAGVRAIVKGLVNCVSVRHLLCRTNDQKICTDYEWMMNNQIYRFLCGEELTKSLAENSEMCIIYG